MAGPTPKTVIVFYSLSGHSARLASKLAGLLPAALVELDAPAFSRGFLGYLKAGISSIRQTRHAAPQKFTTLATFDHLILCGPVWTSFPATPLRGLLCSEIPLPARVSLFLTCGQPDRPTKAFDVAQADLGQLFHATAYVPNAAEDTAEEDRALDTFVKALDDTFAHPLTG